MYQLAAHGRRGQLLQRLPLVALSNVDRNLLDLVDGHAACPSQALDDGLAADALLDVFLDLLEHLAGQHHHRRRAVADLGVLRASNVGQDARGGVDNVQELCAVSSAVSFSS